RLEADTFIYNNKYEKKNAVILTDILNIDFKKITSAGTVFILTNQNTPGWWEETAKTYIKIYHNIVSVISDINTRNFKFR
ncbi:MAG: hypothetical protein ACRDBG_18325, partial [Waterburya sp.]